MDLRANPNLYIFCPHEHCPPAPISANDKLLQIHLTFPQTTPAHYASTYFTKERPIVFSRLFTFHINTIVQYQVSNVTGFLVLYSFPYIHEWNNRFPSIVTVHYFNPVSLLLCSHSGFHLGSLELWSTEDFRYQWRVRTFSNIYLYCTHFI